MPFTLDGVPATVRIAAAAVAVTALVFVGLAVVEFASTKPSRPVVGITTGIGFACYAVLLGLAVRGLLRRRGWARGVAVFAALLQIPIALSFWGGQTYWVAAIALAFSTLIIGCLLTPSATRALTKPKSAAG